jgi:16S rRNA processing protein RimM
MRVITDYPERISKLETLFLGPDYVPHRLLGVRGHRGALLLRLEGVTSRETAERYRAMLIHISIDDAIPLEEGEHYLFQLVGLQVVTEKGRELGTLVDVLETGANDVYVIDGPAGEVLLPAIPEVIREVDVVAGRIVVHLLDGLLEDQ